MLKSIIKIFLKYFQIFLSIIAYKLTSHKKKYIVIGVHEVANILFNLKLIFNDDCIVVCDNKNRFYKNNYYDFDISGKFFSRKYLFSALLFGSLAKNASFFIYLWNNGFLLERESEFKFLRSHNISIICSFLGSDIRSNRLLLNYCKSINFNTYIDYYMPENILSDEQDNICRKLAKQADTYANIIFSSPIDQMSYLKSKQHFFPVIIDESIFSLNYDKFNIVPIKIIHAPSLPILKGTPLVRTVIKMLKNEGYKFHYIELINISHEDVIKELQQSHIVLNQFYHFVPGVLGHEAMATGNAVLMSAKSSCQPFIFNNAWFETEDWQLYYHLKFLLDNPKKIIEYAKNGYEYMVNNFSKENIKKYLFNIFKENNVTL